MSNTNAIGATARAEVAEPGFEVATGSVAGRLHRRLGRPNQDAVSWRLGPGGLVVVVCDGCGSGARSEVGAELTARLWLRALAARVDGGAAVDEALFATAGDEVLDHLAAFAAALAGTGDAERTALISSHLLATSLCAVVTADLVGTHAIGDGVVGLGLQQRIHGPFPDNQPPYLALGLLGRRPTGETWLADATVGSLVLATDGATPLVAATGELDLLDAIDDRLHRNPQALTRRLGLLADDAITIDWDARRVARRPAVLDDDTTIALARWRTP